MTRVWQRNRRLKSLQQSEPAPTAKGAPSIAARGSTPQDLWYPMIGTIKQSPCYTKFKEDSTKESWACALNDLGLPADTYEICVKHINHKSETEDKEKRKQENADSTNPQKV